ncbi:hypothetical protein E2C01_058924 [Portunus trituberculatus]|uniref:Uncharacterized protein n=1 Tax=Portunus trituberculatus TaxID=210409 RepID=A0A5B7H416_PORTR|nr:hypothetical protein [Portunus trituberculatus]
MWQPQVRDSGIIIVTIGILSIHLLVKHRRLDFWVSSHAPMGSARVELGMSYMCSYGSKVSLCRCVALRCVSP